jgi:putative transposase
MCASGHCVPVDRCAGAVMPSAQRKIKAWREYYNEARPHSALGWTTPAEFARQAERSAQSAVATEPEISTSDRY